jgi:hypothetical protein
VMPVEPHLLPTASLGHAVACEPPKEVRRCSCLCLRSRLAPGVIHVRRASLEHLITVPCCASATGGREGLWRRQGLGPPPPARQGADERHKGHARTTN